jgi:hypothetical protein
VTVGHKVLGNKMWTLLSVVRSVLRLGCGMVDRGIEVRFPIWGKTFMSAPKRPEWLRVPRGILLTFYGPDYYCEFQQSCPI